MTIAPDGSCSPAAGEDGTVRIWDTDTGQERATLPGHHGVVSAVAIAPDGSWLATGDDGMVRIWDTGMWRTRASMRIESMIFACAWLRTEGLAVGGSAGLYLFDFLAGTSPATAESIDRDGGLGSAPVTGPLPTW